MRATHANLRVKILQCARAFYMHERRGSETQRWMNCMELIAPRKKTVGMVSAWIANHRKVKMGYATGVRAAATAGLPSAARAVRPLPRRP
mmetsp:Transcript_58804/g.148981  ORF Transcript_58804/g.148981 Transcript_58804/m.148981 type:complete len:90 (+) Transcript_58804:125-394(+)